LLTDSQGVPGPRRRSSEEVAVSAAVARHVRALRQARNWSLDELAGRSGVSKGMVVQIEGERTNPSIGTLCRLAEAFGVNVAALIEAPAEPVARVIGADDPPVLWRGAAGGTGRLLSGVGSGAAEVELWEWRMAPGEDLRSGDHSSGTREVLHVRSGEMVVTVDAVDHRVAAGETMEFFADRPHGYRNDGPEPAVATMVVVTPTGERDRRSQRDRRSHD
jgi:transcriptional regulator with XRE-family HTH domain